VRQNTVNGARTTGFWLRVRRLPSQKQFGDAAMPKDVTFFNEVVPKLFATIVNRYHTGKSVSPSEQPGTAAYNAKVASK
jgi:hypothetical protein